MKLYHFLTAIFIATSGTAFGYGSLPRDPVENSGVISQIGRRIPRAEAQRIEHPSPGWCELYRLYQNPDGSVSWRFAGYYSCK